MRRIEFHEEVSEKFKMQPVIENSTKIVNNFMNP